MKIPILILSLAQFVAMAPLPRVVPLDMVIPPKCPAPCLFGLNSRGEWKPIKLDSSIELLDSGGVPTLRSVPVIVPPATNPTVRRIQIVLERQGDGSLMIPAASPNPIAGTLSVYLTGVYLAPSSTTYQLDPANVRRIVPVATWTDEGGTIVPVSVDYLTIE